MAEIKLYDDTDFRPPAVRDDRRAKQLTGGIRVMTDVKQLEFVGLLREIVRRKPWPRQLPISFEGRGRHNGLRVTIDEAVDGGLAGSIAVCEERIESVRPFALCDPRSVGGRQLAAKTLAGEVGHSLMACQNKRDVGVVVSVFGDLLDNSLSSFVVDRSGSRAVTILGKPFIVSK